MAKTIGIVGLGLIGGSMAKAIKKYTSHKIYGLDSDEATAALALEQMAIDGVLKDKDIGVCDIVIIALYPCKVIEFVTQNIGSFKKGGLIVDCAGVKRQICEELSPLAAENGLCFIGGHPMAGTEKFGFKSSYASLFEKASMILCPDNFTTPQMLKEAEKLFLSIGFGKIKLTCPEEHDGVIAYTSQLPHVVSSAFVKSETAKRREGFSAGSYGDLTRVAMLSEDMWAELFIENGDKLTKELDGLILRLAAYSQAIKEKDYPKLKDILLEGKIAKELNG